MTTPSPTLSLLAHALDTSTRTQEAHAAMRPLRAALRELHLAGGVKLNTLNPHAPASSLYSLISTTPEALLPPRALALDCTVYTSAHNYRRLQIRSSGFTPRNPARYLCSSFETRYPKQSAQSDVAGLGETETVYLDTPEAAIEWLVVKLAPAITSPLPPALNL
jgi:hypothetical protein